MDKLLGLASFAIYCVYGLHVWTVGVSVAFCVGYIGWLYFSSSYAD